MTTRLVIVGCAYLVVAVVAELLFWHHGSTAVTVTHADTGGRIYYTQMALANRSIYQENPGPVITILLMMFVASTAATLSVVYRIRKRSAKLGATGVVVASLVGVFCVLGMLTVGPFILPLAGLLVALALPMDKLEQGGDTPHT